MALELSYDFTELPDGGFPEGIGVGILRTDSGVVTIEPEPAPNTHYYVEGGLGVFNYLEEVLGSQVDWRGLFAVPGILEGKDVDLSMIFSNPIRDFDTSLSEVFVQIGLGFRGIQAKSWVGGMVESMWTPGGGWNSAWKLSIVRVDDGVITYEESITDENIYRADNDLTVRVKGNTVGAMFNGIRSVEKEIDFQGDQNVVLWVKVYLDNGIVKSPVPLLKSISGLSLISGQNYSIFEIPAHYLPSPSVEPHYYRIPVRELIDARLLVTLSHNSWKFREEVLVDRPEDRIRFAASKGAVIVSERQTLPSADVQVCRFKYT
jgi:hypothetical protein